MMSEKWEPDFGKDHAQAKCCRRPLIQREEKPFSPGVEIAAPPHAPRWRRWFRVNRSLSWNSHCPRAKVVRRNRPERDPETWKPFSEKIMLKPMLAPASDSIRGETAPVPESCS
jgi:hypothetical protein